MAKRRKNRSLPPYVYRGKSAYELRLYRGKGVPMRTIKLCKLDVPISEVWLRYEEHQSETVKNLTWLLNEYSLSEEFKANSKATIKYQSALIRKITDYPMKNGHIFGSVRLNCITPGALRKYLDSRRNDGAPVAGNRELAFISVAWNWARERDYVLITNPCSNVKPNKEKPRERYITDDEYDAVYALAPSYLKPAMELAYLCRMRRTEILTSKKSQILEEGFDTIRIKGSKDAVTRWSERLKKAVDYKASEIGSVYIIHDRKGQKIGIEAFKSAWTRLKNKMKQEGIEPFNFHDLKAKGVSDFEGDKLAASGHKDSKMLAVYNRKKIVTDSTR